MANRLSNLKEILALAEANGIPLTDFPVLVEDEMLGETLIGRLPMAVMGEPETTLRVTMKAIRHALGGLDGKTLLRGIVPGVEANGDRFANVDLTAPVFVNNDITADDIRQGNRKVYKSREAVEVLQARGYDIDNKKLLNLLPNTPEARTKVGSKMFLWNAKYIDEVELSLRTKPALVLANGHG